MNYAFPAKPWCWLESCHLINIRNHVIFHETHYALSVLSKLHTVDLRAPVEKDRWKRFVAYLNVALFIAAIIVMTMRLVLQWCVAGCAIKHPSVHQSICLPPKNCCCMCVVKSRHRQQRYLQCRRCGMEGFFTLITWRFRSIFQIMSVM